MPQIPALTRLIVRAAGRDEALPALAAGAEGVEAVSPEAVRPVAGAVGRLRPVGAAIPPMPVLAGLRHPPAARVAVRIEKLDVGPCVVGIEIVRTRGEQPVHG